MKVIDAFKALNRLMIDGHGDLELIAADTRSGVSSSASIYSKTKEVEEYDREAGTLCGWELGKKYVAVYLDH